MVDTLKTASIGMGGTLVSCLGWFPELVSIAAGISTAVYMCIKIYKELK